MTWHRLPFAEFDRGIADAHATVPQLARQLRGTHLLDRAERARQEVHVLGCAFQMENRRDGPQRGGAAMYQSLPNGSRTNPARSPSE